MILDRLMLHNVGTFAGRHEIELTPPSARKPIVLICGLNGAGKTTVLEAIHLALYGPLAQLSGRRSGSYQDYLRGLIHHGVPDSDGAAVELTFHLHQEGVEREIWVRRSWKSVGTSVRELLVVGVNGEPDPALTATWSEQVETFLPRGIAGLFFFDGEQIESLADLERSRQVLDSALAALLGLDLVDRLGVDLGVLRRRHRTKQVPDQLRASVEERQQTVTALRQAEERAVANLANLRVELERAEKRHFELTERYRSSGGELLERREASETAALLHRNEVERIDSEIREELAGASPFLLVEQMLQQVVAQAVVECEAARQRLVVDVVTARDEQTLRQLRAAGIKGVPYTTVKQFLAADRGHRASASVVEQVTGLTDPSTVHVLASAEVPASRKRLQSLLALRAEKNTELDHAERVLVAMPDSQALAHLLQDRDTASAEVVRANAAVVHAEEQLQSLRQDRAKADASYESALDKAAHADLAGDDGRRIVEHIERVQSTLERLRTRAIEDHLGRISGLILEALGRLLRKNQLVTDVTIDPVTQTVHLTGLDGRPLPAQQLSAGERQLLAVALLWGLARASGQPLPIVIDTPLGRLDGSHRQHLVERYFPEASHQVILLSTDTEIDQTAYNRIRRHVGRAYRLEFNPHTSATSVEPGYFWE